MSYDILSRMGDETRAPRDGADDARVCSPPEETPAGARETPGRSRRFEFDFGAREDAETPRPSVYPDAAPPTIGRTTRKILDAAIRVTRRRPR